MSLADNAGDDIEDEKNLRQFAAAILDSPVSDGKTLGIHAVRMPGLAFTVPTPTKRFNRGLRGIFKAAKDMEVLFKAASDVIDPASGIFNRCGLSLKISAIQPICYAFSYDPHRIQRYSASLQVISEISPDRHLPS